MGVVRTSDWQIEAEAKLTNCQITMYGSLSVGASRIQESVGRGLMGTGEEINKTAPEQKFGSPVTS